MHIQYYKTCLHVLFVLYVTYIGAIEVSIATMSKQERSKCSEVYVCGFVPSHLLPNKRPNSLDPFLHPLIEEIKDLFVDGTSLSTTAVKKYLHIIFIGITVQYSAEVAGIEPGDALLRCLLLLWTGDYPAQSEVGKFVCSGIRPCRRCTLEGVGYVVSMHMNAV